MGTVGILDRDETAQAPLPDDGGYGGGDFGDVIGDTVDGTAGYGRQGGVR